MDKKTIAIIALTALLGLAIGSLYRADSILRWQDAMQAEQQNKQWTVDIFNQMGLNKNELLVKEARRRGYPIQYVAPSAQPQPSPEK